MFFRATLFSVLFAFSACGEEEAILERQSTDLGTLPSFEEIDDPTANMVVEVSDAGRFELTGTIDIQEIDDTLTPRMSLLLNGHARETGDYASFALEVALGSTAAQLSQLKLGVRDSAQRLPWVRYPRGDAALARPINAARVELQANQGFRMELTLGQAEDILTGEKVEGDTSATALVQGRIGVSCMVHEHPSRKYKDPMGAKRMLSRIADPSYRTQFCRDAIDELGIRDFLDFPPEGPVVAHPTEATSPPTTMPDGTLRPTDWQTTTPTVTSTEPTVEPVAVIDAGIPSKLTK